MLKALIISKFLKPNNPFILESTHHRMRRVRAHVCARSAGLLHSGRDEVREAAFCAVSLFPWMDRSLK